MMWRALTLRVTVGSLCALDIRWANRVVVRRKRKRMLVAFVKSCSTGEYVKFLEPGRPLIRDTTIYTRHSFFKKNKSVLMTGEIQQRDGPLYLSVLQRKYPWVFCGAELVIVVHHTTIGLFSKPLETLTLWVCIEKFKTLWTFATIYFTFYWSFLSIMLL